MILYYASPYAYSYKIYQKNKYKLISTIITIVIYISLYFIFIYFINKKMLQVYKMNKIQKIANIKINFFLINFFKNLQIHHVFFILVFIPQIYILINLIIRFIDSKKKLEKFDYLKKKKFQLLINSLNKLIIIFSKCPNGIINYQSFKKILLCINKIFKKYNFQRGLHKPLKKIICYIITYTSKKLSKNNHLLSLTWNKTLKEYKISLEDINNLLDSSKKIKNKEKFYYQYIENIFDIFLYNKSTELSLQQMRSSLKATKHFIKHYEQSPNIFILFLTNNILTRIKTSVTFFQMDIDEQYNFKKTIALIEELMQKISM